VRGPDDTPSRLAAVAEQLFAEHGEEAISLRAIAREARASPAAVHYHYGGRDELLRVVVNRHLEPLNGRRLRFLDFALANHGPAVPVEIIIEAAVRPDLELLARLRRGRVTVARFLGRAWTQPGPAVAGCVTQHFEPLARAFVPALRRSLPEVGKAELRDRLRLVMATVAMLLATAPEPDEPGPLGTDDVDEQVRRLVAFCAAGMAAPPRYRATGTDTDEPEPRPRTSKRKKR
jgi:AcrR family transcriptional regulator